MLLLFGPVRSAHPSTVGGTTRSFGLLTAELAARGVPFHVVPTNRWQGWWALPFNLLAVLVPLLWRAPGARVVMLNANPRGAVFLGPLIHAYCRVWDRPFVFRMFGGDLIELYESQPPRVQSRLRESVLRADLVLLQTRRLVDYFGPLAPNVSWLPTARPAPAVRRPPGPYARRLLYVGAIRESKGVEAILRFRREHGDQYHVSLYGPIVDARYRGLGPADGYGGVLAPDDVVQRMAENDLLLLPTRHEGEGYPGVVIEANAVGLPVIASRWLAIPELVADGRTGALVPPGDDDALAAAILAVDDATWQRWSAAALQTAATFDTTVVHRALIAQLARLGMIVPVRTDRETPG